MTGLAAALLPVAVVLVFLALALAVLAFEVWMFIDAYQNPRLTSNEKILWMVGMVLIHPFIAIIYYFAARKPRI